MNCYKCGVAIASGLDLEGVANHINAEFGIDEAADADHAPFTEDPYQGDHADPIEDRLFGMIFGGAIGDALGSAFESLSSRNIRSIVGDPVIRDFYAGQPGSLMPHRKPGIRTDDTAMTLALVARVTDGDRRSSDEGGLGVRTSEPYPKRRVTGTPA